MSQDPDQALFPNGPDGEPIAIDRIDISIVAGCEFRWPLWSGSTEIFAVVADRDEVAGMLQASKILVNTELGVPPDVVGVDPRLN